MEPSSVVTLLATAVSAIATLVLAFLTAKYVRLTSMLADEARAAKYPNVFVDIEIDNFGIKFVVGNAGATPAQNIRFRVKDTVPWQIHERLPSGVSSLSIVKNGIAYLPPGRTLKFYAGSVRHVKEGFAPGSVIDVGLSFDVEPGKSITRDFCIDMSSYSDVLYESFTNPAEEVALAIRETESKKSSSVLSSGIIARLTKSSCPICQSEIPRGAKKCPMCLEFLPTKVSDEQDM